MLCGTSVDHSAHAGGGIVLQVKATSKVYIVDRNTPMESLRSIATAHDFRRHFLYWQDLSEKLELQDLRAAFFDHFADAFTR